MHCMQVEELPASEALAVSRPSRRAAASQKTTYVEELSSSESDEPEEDGSDFQLSD